MKITKKTKMNQIKSNNLEISKCYVSKDSDNENNSELKEIAFKMILWAILP